MGRIAKHLVKVKKLKREYTHDSYFNGLPKDYSQDEEDFIKAIDRYKCQSHHQHLTCCEVLMIAKSLGYQKEKT